MNWKQITVATIPGLIIGFAGVFGWLKIDMELIVIPGVLLFFAWYFARYSQKRYFLYGFLVTLNFFLDITIIRMELIETYWYHNPGIVDFIENLLHKIKVLRSPFMILSLAALVSALITGGITYLLALLFERQKSKAV